MFLNIDSNVLNLDSIKNSLNSQFHILYTT